ncbi:hypothetical protein IUY40_11055 [Flavobacterium sp. ALJ2]|uniref:hypothetical protein n=1 Tax=Flavobacterium sp. ALJ2 TaxID=2786960 RepID=UPI00189E3A05|nr:hypothetical protein [Flavobacterium sp. ALJ2]MBF7092078.1 hypothetical protein [Flavobacterium sp. ALJ2]
MKQILILMFILCLVECNGQTKKENLSNKSNGIILKFKNTSVAFQGITSVNDINNIKDDFIIQSDDLKVLIEPAYLESDLLDGKTLIFSNDAVEKVKITFSYDAVFYGEEKKNTTLGFTCDTTMILIVSDRKVKVPSFINIKKVLMKRIEKKEVFDIAYLVNQNYFNKIINYRDKDSPDYNSAMAFFKKNKKDFKMLEDLFINVDYSKFSIEFVDKKKINSIITFNRMFDKYKFVKVEKQDISVPKGFYILDSTLINLNDVKYKILTLEKNEIKNKDNAQHNSNPIVILEKKDNGYYKKNDNYNLVYKYDDNCPADGYGGIVSKKNYFTVQQTFCMDFMFVNSYTTFKIDENSNKIYLHKYGEEYSDRSNPDRKKTLKVWSIKDFGVVKFENVNETFLNKLRNVNVTK